MTERKLRPHWRLPLDRPTKRCAGRDAACVAGDRGRQSNYPYGAAKGGLELYAQGLSHRFALAGGQVTMHLIKPGFVDTPMTDDMAKGGPLWASPEQVAESMRRAVKAGRPVAYVPWFWQVIMMIIRSLPRFILHKTGL